MRKKQPEAKPSSSDKQSAEELQETAGDRDEIAPVDFNSYSKRVGEIITRALRRGRKKTHPKGGR
jgi:hypothetical protein